MKALHISTLLLLAAGTLFSQKTNVETAFIAIAKYQTRTDDPGDTRTAYLREAKSYIDKAYENETTSNYDKMWFTRGKVYFYIYADTLGNKSLDPDPAEVSVNSLIKYLKSGEKLKYEDDAYTFLATATAFAFNEGYDAYYKNNYERALKYFQKAMEAIPANDEAKLKLRNVDAGKVKRMAAYTAKNMKNNELAKKYLQELIDAAYADPAIYSDMKDIVLAEGDTTAALDYLSKGRKLYPDNQDLIIREMNTYIQLEMQDVLIDRLNKAIENDPYNEHFYFNRGTMFQGKSDSTKNDEALRAELEAKAVADFEKALEINPQYMDALYNLGALYVNKGSIYLQESNSFGYKEKAKSDAALKKANDTFAKAIPYLELAYEIDESNPQLTKVLMDLYLKTENLEKYKELKAKSGQ